MVKNPDNPIGPNFLGKKGQSMEGQMNGQSWYDQRQRGQVKEVIRFLFLAQSPHVVDKYRRGQFNEVPNHFKWGQPLDKREFFFERSSLWREFPGKKSTFKLE